MVRIAVDSITVDVAVTSNVTAKNKHAGCAPCDAIVTSTDRRGGGGVSTNNPDVAEINQRNNKRSRDTEWYLKGTKSNV